MEEISVWFIPYP